MEFLIHILVLTGVVVWVAVVWMLAILAIFAIAWLVGATAEKFGVTGGKRRR